MNTICKMRDIYKALSIFETAFEEVYGISLNEAMVLCALREAGKEKTLDVSISELAALYGFEQTEDNGSPKSAREAALIEEARRQKEIARKKAEQREYEAKKQSNLSTEQILKWKYSRYSGD